MNRDYFSIDAELDASWGPSTQSKVLLPIPENVRELPCDTCSLAVSCEVNFTECSAFRNWSARGDYKDSDVGRFVRAMK
jgi:hypothetical protein